MDIAALILATMALGLSIWTFIRQSTEPKNNNNNIIDHYIEPEKPTQDLDRQFKQAGLIDESLEIDNL